ncbi:MAG: hypothetical protein HWE18_01480 [Gammaproteobacteria bacterium]|nr:hypothetical protein [Gammaproteobacteria bacterium]
MKTQLRNLFSVILNPLEAGNEPYSYKDSHRTILLAIAVLFTFLATLVCVFSAGGETYGYLIPVVVFGGVAAVGFIVGLLGTDRAVAKIWGNK